METATWEPVDPWPSLADMFPDACLHCSSMGASLRWDDAGNVYAIECECEKGNEMAKTIYVPQVGVNTKFEPRLAPPPIAEPPVTQPQPEPYEPLVNATVLSEPAQYIYYQMIGHRQQRRPELLLHAALMTVAHNRAQYVADWMDNMQPGDELPGHNDHLGYGPNYYVRLKYKLPEWYSQAPDANWIESLAYGHTGADAAWEMWAKSPMHAAHLLGHELNEPDKPHPVYRWQWRCGIAWAFLKNGRGVTVVITCPKEGEERHGEG